MVELSPNLLYEAQVKSFVRAMACFSWIVAAVAQEQPPATQPPDAPRPSTGIQQAPPPIPKVPDVRQPGETGYFVGVSAWFPKQAPSIDKGKAAAFDQARRLQQQRKAKKSTRGGDGGGGGVCQE